MSSESVVSASDWLKGITLSILASMIGGASKLAIRKSWIIMEELEQTPSSPRSSGGSDSVVELTGDGRKKRRRRRNERDDEFREVEEENNALYPDDDNDNHDDDDDDIDENDSSLDLDINPPPSPPRLPSTPKNQQSSSKTELKSKCLRYAGMIGMTILNPLCCVFAMNYASPSILAPFSGLTLVWIVLFAELLIGESPTRIQLMAAALIVGGQVVVAVWGDHVNDGDVTVEDVIQSYNNPFFLVYFLLLFIWMLFLFFLIKSKSSSPMFRRFAWGVSGGSITGLQNFLKDSLTLIKASKAESSISPPYSYLILFFLCGSVSAFGGLLLLTACMKRYDATYSASMFVVSFVVSASIMAAVHYHTFENLKGVVNYIMYPLGLCVLLLGALILVRDSSGGGGGDEEELGSGEYSRMEGDNGGDDDDARGSSCDLKRPLVNHQPKVEFL